MNPFQIFIAVWYSGLICILLFCICTKPSFCFFRRNASRGDLVIALLLHLLTVGIIYKAGVFSTLF